MSVGVELEINRINTLAFISANPVSIDLIPRVQSSNGDGTVWIDGPARSSQVMRLIDQSNAGGPNPGVFVTLDGKQREVEFHLLGGHNAVVEPYDYWLEWVTNGTAVKWEVLDVFPPNGYEVRARVGRYGR